MNMIKTIDLSKKFNGLKAVDKVSLKIKQGEIFGLLGPNGAGKTTLISMLSTILKPTKGKALINGFDILSDSDKVRKSIGIVFQDPSLDHMLTAKENLELHAMFYGIKNTEKKIDFVLSLVELEKRKNDMIKTFSGGMRRRLEIARSLMHEPKVLFLDEPTLGLDPQTRVHVWNYIEKLARKKNMTILLTTHYIDEAEALCDRIAIIDNGKIIALDTVKNLKKTIGNEVIKIKTNDSIKKIKKLKFVKAIKKHDSCYHIVVDNAEKAIVKLLKIIHAEKAEIRKPTLNDVFLELTGKEIREEEPDSNYTMRVRTKWH